MNGRGLAPVVSAAVAAATVIACFVLPSTSWLPTVATVGAVAIVAWVVSSAARSRPAATAPWLGFSVGTALWAAAAVNLAHVVDTGARDAPGPPEALILLGIPWMASGVIGISFRRSTPSPSTATVIESVVWATAASAVAWLVAIDPLLGRGTRPEPPVWWPWYSTFVLADVVLVAFAVVAASRPSPRRSSRLVAGAAFAVAAGAHAWTWRWSSTDPAAITGARVAGLLVAGFVIGLAAWTWHEHSPVWTQVGRPAASRRRMIGLTVVAVVPVALLALLVGFRDRPVANASVAVVAGASVLIVCLVVWRVGSMVTQVRRATEHIGQIRLAAMVEHASDVVLVVDGGGVVRYASPGLAEALGHRPDAWIGRLLVDMVDDRERGATESQLEQLLARGGDHAAEFETVLVRDDGQRRHGSVVMRNRLGDQAVDGVVVTFRDITEQRDLERQLSHRAFHDELTGLANRALFLDRMDHALRIGRNGGEPVMVLFIDLDDFKDVNDVHGHGVGDETLRVIARRIMESAGSGDTAARLGGDEFAVLLEDGGGIDRAIDLAERLLTRLHDPVTVHGIDVVVLASIGIAVAPMGASTTSLLRDADIAMYEAKRAGKGQVRIFDPAMRRVASRHLVYRNELAVALEQEQLRVVYLPYVELTTGEVRGAEALVRWHHPEHGEIAPSEFIPIAERTGLIVPIGRWVVARAVQQAATWRADVELFVSVNLTAAELRQHDLVEFLDDVVSGHGLEPSRLMLEVTETDLMEGGDRAVRSVEALRARGFAVALDDFGAGLCSISHLQQHPVDMLKIDRAYVAELGSTTGDAALARTLLHLSHTLRVESAAEGIERPEQLHELRRSGCRLGQGYLLSGELEETVVARRFGRRDPSLAGRPA